MQDHDHGPKKRYPFTDEGLMQQAIDAHQQQPPKYGSADFSVQPDKLNYERYGICRPNNTSLSYDGNLTTRGKFSEDPKTSSRPIPNGMWPMRKRPTGGGY